MHFWKPTVAVSTLAVLVLCSCGGGGSGGLSGTIRTTRYTLPAGETRTLSGDLIVRSDGDIEIDGTLRVPAGISLALLAQGNLIVRGKIESAPTRARESSPTRAEDPTVAAIFYAGGAMAFETTGSVHPAATVLAVAGTASDITIAGNIIPDNAPDGTGQTDHGDDGYDVEIGTERAIAYLLNKHGQVGFKPANVTITGVVRGGHGGHGFDDPSGRLSGRDLIVQGSDGGDGGDVLIEKSGRLVGTAKGGDGGDGGDAGTAETPARAPDGVASGERGGHVTARAGNGGPLGFGVPDTTAQLGERGSPGLINVAAGSGGPGGDGGNASLTPGVNLNHDSMVQTTADAGRFTVTGGNGGGSDAPTRAGGRGGNLTISKEFIAFRVAAEAGSRINNFGNGGRGFDGCAILPSTDGSAGGAGGNISSLLSLSADKTAFSFNGASGGNGVTNPGAGGAKGQVVGGSVTISPHDGTTGGRCPAIDDPRTGYLAVKLDYDLGADFKRGDIVPLYRVAQGHVSEAEDPVTSTQGCAEMHLHGTPIAIRALKGGRWVDLGPFSDLQQSKCGFGTLMITQNKEIQSATGVR